MFEMGTGVSPALQPPAKRWAAESGETPNRSPISDWVKLELVERAHFRLVSQRQRLMMPLRYVCRTRPAKAPVKPLGGLVRLG